MRVLHINMTYDIGSTGRFIKYIKESLENSGNECYVICGHTRVKTKNVFVTQSKLVSWFEIALGRLLGNHGLNCYFQTRRVIQYMDKVQPDVVHLHNLHGDYINFSVLFDYIKKKQIPVVWKLPDCWAFTGHCAYYDFVGCSKWKSGCGSCPQMRQYPVTYFFDRSSYMLAVKKRSFLGVNKMIITPPSIWLSNEVKRSFLGTYEVRVVNNGFDSTSFYPRTDGDIGVKTNENRYVILGVMFCFDIRKGVDYFNYLAEKLPDYYKIIVVGFADKKHYMNKKILMVDRTDSVEELAKYYSFADVFVNPTLEENFPSVNIESLACGTPIVAFDTGGTPEAISDKTGIVVKRGDKEALLKAVRYVCEEHPFSRDDCVEQSKQFTKERMVDKYTKLYDKMAKEVSDA